MLKQSIWVWVIGLVAVPGVLGNQDTPPDTPAAVESAAVTPPAAFTEALQQAEKQRKYLVAYFRNDGCAPCDQFEKTALTSQPLAKWLERYAVYVPLNVSDPATAAFAAAREVKEFPTLLFLGDKGDELGRAEANDAVERPMVMANNAVSNDRIAAAGAFLPWIGEEVVLGTMQRAASAILAGNHEEALELYKWCLDHRVTHSPHFSRNYLEDLMKGLARLGDVYPAARKELDDRIREAERRTVQGRDLKAQWFNIIKFGYLALGREDRIVAHYDELKAKYPESSLMEAFGRLIYEQLLRAGRYEDLRWSIAEEDDLPKLMMDISQGLFDRPEAIKILTARHEVLLGIGELSRATAVAQETLKFDKSAATKLALAEACVRTGQQIPDAERLAREVFDETKGRNIRAVMVLARVMARDDKRKQDAVEMVIKALEEADSEKTRKELNACLIEIRATSAPEGEKK